jgi:hypothetical protein
MISIILKKRKGPFVFLFLFFIVLYNFSHMIEPKSFLNVTRMMTFICVLTLSNVDGTDPRWCTTTY